MAIQLDPEFAFAHALAARIHYARVMLGWTEDDAKEILVGLGFAERATSIDPKSDYGHVMRAGLLSFLGRYRDAEDAFAVAERLNPNSLVLWMGQANAEFSLEDPDPELVETVARKALRLSPQDPQAFLFYNMIGAAHLIRNSWAFNEASADAYAMACRYPNANELIVFNATCASAKVGRLDDAARFLDLVLSKNPSLTEKKIRERYSIYKWLPKLLTKNADAFEKLIELGLPRE